MNSIPMPTERKLIFERGISLLSHVIKVIKPMGRLSSNQDTEGAKCVCLAKGTLKTIQSYWTNTDSSDEYQSSVCEYIARIVKLVDTYDNMAESELESQILRLGFSCY